MFRYGDGVGARVFYTDAESDITIVQPTESGVGTEVVTYVAFPIQRGAITASGALDKSSLEVRLSSLSPIADLFRQFPSSGLVLLTIRGGHQNDPNSEWLVSWVGKVLSGQPDLSEVVLNCEPASSAMRRIGLRRCYQYGCPHVLYGPSCRADRPAATVTLLTVEVLGAVLTFASGFNTVPLEKYLGGLAEWTDANGSRVVRSVLRITAQADATVDVLLSGPAGGLEAGGNTALSYGCSHTMDDCRDLHVPSDEPVTAGGNIHNFGGQPFIPTKNPIGLYNNYY